MNADTNEIQLNQTGLAYIQSLSRDAAYNTTLRWLSGKDSRRSRLVAKALAPNGKAMTDLFLSEALEGV